MVRAGDAAALAPGLALQVGTCLVDTAQQRPVRAGLSEPLPNSAPPPPRHGSEVGGPDGLPESLVGGLLGVRAPGWPPGLGEDCREMKEGSLERLLEPVPAEAASWSKDREAEGEAEAAGGEQGEGEEEAAGNTRGEEGGEAEPAASAVGELVVCLAGRWAPEDFLRERKGAEV